MKNDNWFRARAKQLYHQEGELEGAYVAAWVWVPLREEESDS
jgi:hypothetical protein